MRRIFSSSRLHSLPRCSSFRQRVAPRRHGRQPGLRRRRQRERAVHERLRRALQPRRHDRRPQRAGRSSTPSASGTTWQVTPLSGRSRRAATTCPARFGGGDRRGVADTGRHRNVQPRRFGRQGRAGPRPRPRSPAARLPELLRRSARGRPRRLRLGNRLRRRRSRAGDQQYDRGGPRGRRLHGHRRERERLLRSGADAAQLGRRRCALLGGAASAERVSQDAPVDIDIQPVLSIALERPSISFGNAATGRDSGACLGARDRREQPRDRIRADRPPLGVPSRRPPAWPLGDCAERRPARRRARRRRDGGDSDRAGGRPADRDDVRSERSGRRRLGDQRRLRLAAARRRARPLHGHGHLHRHRTMIGARLSARRPASRARARIRGRGAGRRPSRSRRRPPASCWRAARARRAREELGHEAGRGRRLSRRLRARSAWTTPDRAER